MFSIKLPIAELIFVDRFGCGEHLVQFLVALILLRLALGQLQLPESLLSDLGAVIDDHVAEHLELASDVILDDVDDAIAQIVARQIQLLDWCAHLRQALDNHVDAVVIQIVVAEIQPLQGQEVLHLQVRDHLLNRRISQMIVGEVK